MSFTEDFFVFYDTETTGLDINFSQIIQVGCVLTDNNFNILEELNLSSKVLPWIVPSPDAFLYTCKQIVLMMVFPILK